MSRAARPWPIVFFALVGAACVPRASSAPAAASTGSAVRITTASPRAAPRTVSLAGAWKYLPYNGEGNMSVPEIDDSSWPSMALPSSWFLLGKKEYPPKATAMPVPFGDNAPGELWPVDRDAGFDYSGTVWFRRELAWTPRPGLAAILDLDMVDYYAEVFVNGTSVGRHEGYFQHWSVDATRALHAGANVIAVKVSAPPLAFDMSQQYAISWPKMQNQVKGIFSYHDTRPGATSVRGQERSTGGILRGVGLHESTGVDLEEIRVTPLDVSAASARLVVEATVRNWTDGPRDVSLDGVVRPSNFEAPQSYDLHAAERVGPGYSRIVREIKIDHPQLWWSWDYGKPNLYQATARLTDDGVVAPERTARFGIRSIRRDGDWVVYLNDQRIYPRGTNYIATQWLSQADRDFYARDLRLMLDAQLNSVRVHAHIERPEFYDLADELGMMVWQDFPLQWGYTDLPAFRAEALRQAADMVYQYGNHASIVLWSMHNEAPYAMAWMKHRDPQQNRALDEALAACVRGLDASRIVHRDSGTGDGHYYYGWYDGTLGDVATAKLTPMITEYGAAALPAVSTLRTMFDGATLWPKTKEEWEAWQFADFQPKNTFSLAKIEQGKDLAAFVENTQRYQAIVVRYTTELLRRRKWAGSTGVYQFMLTDDWPSITWSVVDYFRKPKLGYAALQQSMRVVLPSVEYDPADPTKPVSLWVVSDRKAPIAAARVSWTVTQGGRTEASGERTVDVPADAALRVKNLGSVAALGHRDGLLTMEVRASDGTTLATSTLAANDFLEEPAK